MDPVEEAKTFGVKVVALSVILLVTIAPMLGGLLYFRLHRNWDAIWLTWLDDPHTTITICWHWGLQKKAYVLYWNETFRGIIRTGRCSKTNLVTIQHLSPDTEYAYVIGFFEGQKMVNWSNILRFRTAPREAKSFRVLVQSDTHAPSYGALRRFVERASSENFDFTIHCGDLVDRSYEENWASFFIAEQRILSVHPIMPTLGNHEVMYGGDPSYYHRLTGHDRWYCFEYSNALFVTIYVANYDEFKFPEEEREFLLRAMRYADKHGMWKILYFHIPPVSPIPAESNPQISQIVMPLIEECSPHVVLMGHVHAYARMHVGDRTTYVIMGPLGGIPNVYAADMRGVDSYAFGYGYLLMSFNNNTIRCEYRTLDGRTVDTFEVYR